MKITLDIETAKVSLAVLGALSPFIVAMRRDVGTGGEVDALFLWA